MADVRYSPIDAPTGEPSDDWGRLEIWWDSAVLFGWVWFFGSVGT